MFSKSTTGKVDLFASLLGRLSDILSLFSLIVLVGDVGSYRSSEKFKLRGACFPNRGRSMRRILLPAFAANIALFDRGLVNNDGVWH